MLTTIDTLMNSSRCSSTQIGVQVVSNALQDNLSPSKRHYLIYYTRLFLRILEFGYPASYNLINSITSSCFLNLCVTPLSSLSFTIYVLPITIFGAFLWYNKEHCECVYIHLFLSTLALGYATIFMKTSQHISPG